MACNEPQHSRLATTDHDDRLGNGLWLAVGIVDVIMLSVKRHRFFPPERFDDLEHLFKLLDTFFGWGKVIAVGQVFVLFPARSDTQDESSAAQIV